MTIQFRSVFLSAALAAMLLPVAVAQDQNTAPGGTPGAPADHEKNVEQRSRAQQDRIAQGVKSGELTPEEAARLENKETRLANEAKAMKEANGGKLTAEDRAKLEREQGKIGKQIYHQKHDPQTTQTATPAGVAGQREQSQQDRIAQGMASGQLTPAEGAKLENREAKINNEVNDMKAANGGKLSAEDKAKVNRQQRRTSRAIYRQKHDGQHR